MRKLIVITGPTATGKSILGAALAKAVGGEVVSADSMQIYKHMDIGTAKPTEQEKLGVPHHMLDVIPPWEDYSAARYVAEASGCIDDILKRGKQPVLAGGTGLYIDSLISGLEFSARGDAARRREIEEDYDERGGEAMLEKLRRFDPESAAKLNAKDKKRIVRAIEVYETTGVTISEHDHATKLTPPRYDAVKYALTFAGRDTLYARIDARIDTMIRQGLEAEVRSLLDMGVPPGSTAMQAIGYKEMADAINGCCDMAAAVERIKQESRRYAKRQLTWLRRDSGVNWVTWSEAPEIESTVQSIITESKFERQAFKPYEGRPPKADGINEK